MREKKKGAVAEGVTAVHLGLGWVLLGTLRNTNTALPITPGKQGELAGSPWKDMRPPCGVPPGPRPPLGPSRAGSALALEEAGQGQGSGGRAERPWGHCPHTLGLPGRAGIPWGLRDRKEHV